MKQQNPGFTTYGGEAKRIAGVDTVIKHNDKFSVGNLKVLSLLSFEYIRLHTYL